MKLILKSKKNKIFKLDFFSHSGLVLPRMAVNCKCQQARRFQLTLNEADKFEDIKKYLVEHPKFRYIIACKEKFLLLRF